MLAFLIFAAAAAPDGKTMAMDDWHALEITGVAGEASGPLYLRVQAGTSMAMARPTMRS